MRQDGQTHRGKAVAIVEREKLAQSHGRFPSPAIPEDSPIVVENDGFATDTQIGSHAQQGEDNGT
jgi:hypothetical protein